MSSEAYVDLRHLNRIADEIDVLSACVVMVAIDEIEYKRGSIKEAEFLKSKGVDVYHSVMDNNLTEDELLNELFGE